MAHFEFQFLTNLMKTVKNLTAELNDAKREIAQLKNVPYQEEEDDGNYLESFETFKTIRPF